MTAELFERLVVRLNQAALAHCGHGLQMCQIRGANRQAKPSYTGSHGPTADQHHVALVVHKSDELVGNGRDTVLVERAVLVREHARTHLDHDGLRASRNFSTNIVCHRCISQKMVDRRRE
jgi:hypothetical protein